MGHSRFKKLWAFDGGHFAQGGGWRLAGVDEAGRAPLAGPVVAGAVILYRTDGLKHLNDSKQVPRPLREELFKTILQNAIVGVGMASVEEIDELNIYHASLLAMKRAVLALTRTPDLVLVDGNALIKELPLEQKALVSGDARSAHIAAASIVAKVYRDRWMERLDEDYPGYGFKAHKGYPTPAHFEALRKLGPAPVHRQSFAPVRNWQQSVPLEAEAKMQELGT